MEPQQPIPTPVTPPQYTPSDSARLSHKPLIIFLISLLVVLVGAMGIYAYKAYRTPQPTILPTPVPQLNISPTSDTTTEWKTYRNEEYEYEIKHPSDWTVSDVSNLLNQLSHVRFQGENYFFAIGVSNESLESVIMDIKYNRAQEVLSDEEIIIDGIVGRKVTAQYGVGGPNEMSTATTYLVPFDNLLYIISGDVNNNEEVLLFDQILSTFRFVDNNQNTEGLKTYINDKKAISFQYPSSWSYEMSNLHDPNLPSSTIRFFSEKNSFKLSFWHEEGANTSDLIALIKNYGISTDQKYSNIIVAGKKGVKATLYQESFAGSSLYIEQVVTSKDNVAYFFRWSYPSDNSKEKNKQLYDQILSTFKFLE